MVYRVHGGEISEQQAEQVFNERQISRRAVFNHRHSILRMADVEPFNSRASYCRGFAESFRQVLRSFCGIADSLSAINSEDKRNRAHRFYGWALSLSV
jgi:hypothetical protein